MLIGGSTYLQLNTDKGTQQIIQWEARGRIISLTRKSPVRQKRSEMRACMSRPSPGPALSYSLSWGSLECQSTSGGHRESPSGFRPWCLLVNDPCLTCWRLCSHPHVHHTLACRSSGQDEPSCCWRWPDTHTRASFSSFARLHPLLARFSLVPLSFTLLFIISERISFTFSSQNVFLYLRGVSVGPTHPTLTPPHWRTVNMTTRVLSKKAGVGAHGRLLLRKYKGGFQSL